MGALTPSGKVVTLRLKWIPNASLYTLAGGLTSVLVGFAFGAAGVFLPSPLQGIALTICLGIAVAGAMREFGFLELSMPQLKRQTGGAWVKQFNAPVAAALWGLDLGLTFASWLTFAGAWLLAALAVTLGDPPFGAALFLAYWSGRAISVWLAPALLPNAARPTDLLLAIAAERPVFQRLHGVALVVAAGLIVVLIADW